MYGILPSHPGWCSQLLLGIADKLQKRICRTVGPSLDASLEPLAHRRNVASLSLFYRYYFGRCSSELAELVPLPFSRGRSTRYSDRWHDFSVTIPRCYKDVHLNSFFPHAAALWNSLPIECFSLIYELIFFVLLFLVSPCLVVAVQPCSEEIPIKRRKNQKICCFEIFGTVLIFGTVTFKTSNFQIEIKF